MAYALVPQRFGSLVQRAGYRSFGLRLLVLPKVAVVGPQDDAGGGCGPDRVHPFVINTHHRSMNETSRGGSSAIPLSSIRVGVAALRVNPLRTLLATRG